jgi:RHS repeat-associated protein
MLTALPEAAKEKMLSPVGPTCADPAALFEEETRIGPRVCQGKKPHQGFAAENRALFLGQSVSNSASALGFQFLTVENRVRSRCTGKERDGETGLDYFGARYYSSSLGHFATADWAEKPEAVPYSDLDDPQSLNLYSYVRNLPTTKTDATGHCLEDACIGEAYLAVALVTTVSSYLASPSGQHALSAVGEAIGSLFSRSSNNSPPPSTTTTTQTGTPGTTATTTVQTGTPGTTTTTAETGTPASSSQAGTVSTSTAHSTSNTGTIYVVPGKGTQSGKPYVGRHNKPNPAKTRRSNDGRDRTQAQVVDTYPANDTQAGRVAEQQQIDQQGGVQNLDNKRNEIAPKKE